MTRPKNVVAVTPGGPVTEDMLLGWYVIWGCSEQYRPAITIKRNWRAAGLPEERLPRDRQPVHVAQEAIRSVEGDASSNGTRRRIIVDEVEETGAEYIGQATLQVWTPDAHAVDFEKSLRVVFNKKTGDFDRFDPLDPEGYEHLRGIESQIREHFEQHSTRIPGSKMRTIIRHMLEDDAHAENVSISHKTSLYYVTTEHGKMLDGLAEFLVKTYPGTAVNAAGGLHKIPVVNAEGEREFLKRKFVQNCEDELRAYRDRLLELVRQQDERKRGFRADLIVNLQEQRKALIEKRERFAALLDDTLTELDQSSKLADQALVKILREAELAPA